MKTCKTVLASRQAVHTTPPEAMISLGLVVPFEAPVRTAGRGAGLHRVQAPLDTT